MANYIYTRVSTNKQETENQELDIQKYIEQNNLTVDGTWTEIISGRKEASIRELGKLIEVTQQDDTIIIWDVSRLGRDFFDLMNTFSKLFKKGVRVHSIRQNHTFIENSQSIMLISFHGIQAFMEVENTRERIKASYRRKKAEGSAWGRKEGSKNKTTKLSGREDEVIKLHEEGNSITSIAHRFNVSYNTIKTTIKTLS